MTLKLIYPAETSVALGLEIFGRGHSVADLLTIWQPLCDDVNVYKQFAAGQHAACEACVSNCCNTAYVTPDIISLRHMAIISGLSLEKFAELHLDADKLALGIPVLNRPCFWLTPSGRCDIYEARSLLCRFYLCTPLEGKLEQLIYSLTLVGMIATSQELGLTMPAPGLALTSFDRLNIETMLNWESHPGVEAFRLAANYQEVSLDLFLD